MDLEKMINTPRLKREQELKEHEEYENTDDLKRKIDIVDENIARLEEEKRAISQAANSAQNFYYPSAKKNGLEEFKAASKKIDEIVETNKDVLEGRGISDKVSLVNDEQLNKSDEIEEYRRTGKKLRQDVEGQRVTKEKLKEAYANYGDVVLRKEVRVDTFNEIWDKVREIQNSVDSLHAERKKIVEQLAQRLTPKIKELYKNSASADRMFQWSTVKNSPYFLQTSLEGDTMQFQRLMDHYGVDAMVIVLQNLILSDRQTEETIRQMSFAPSVENFKKAIEALAEYEVVSIENENATSDRARDAYRKSKGIKKEKERGEAMLRRIAEEQLKYSGEESVLLNIESEDKHGRLSPDEAYSYKLTYTVEAVEDYNRLKNEKTELEKESAHLEEEITQLEGNKSWLFAEGRQVKLDKLKLQKRDLDTKLDMTNDAIENHYKTAATPIKEKIALPLSSESQELSLRIREIAAKNMYVHDYLGKGRGLYSGERTDKIYTLQEYLSAIEKATREFIDEQKLSDNEQLLAAKYQNLMTGYTYGKTRDLAESVAHSKKKWEEERPKSGF